jgi:hypothetical protein
MTDAPETLWITDAEMIRRLGVPEKIMRPVIKALDQDRRSQFPRKVALYGDRRYWPAVKAYMDRTNGLKLAEPERRSA